MMWDVRATAKGPSYTLRGHTDRVTGLLASGGSVYSCSEVGFWVVGSGLSISPWFLLHSSIAVVSSSGVASHILVSN